MFQMRDKVLFLFFFQHLFTVVLVRIDLHLLRQSLLKITLVEVYLLLLAFFIRNNRDIKATKLNGEEYKTSQYADDMSLLTDGCPYSLYKILHNFGAFRTEN